MKTTLPETMQAAAIDGFGGIERIKLHMPKTAVILAGGMTRERAEKMISDGLIDLAAFGASFISNPDLVARLQNNWPLTPPDRDTFYGGGAEGYIDYRPYLAA